MIMSTKCIMRAPIEAIESPWFGTPALEGDDMTQRPHVTVTGRLWSDFLLLLVLAAILLIGAPRLAVYYTSPRVVDPAVETSSGSSIHEVDFVRHESGVGA
jgi:hypothetical protein